MSHLPLNIPYVTRLHEDTLPPVPGLEQSMAGAQHGSAA